MHVPRAKSQALHSCQIERRQGRVHTRIGVNVRGNVINFTVNDEATRDGDWGDLMLRPQLHPFQICRPNQKGIKQHPARSFILFNHQNSLGEGKQGRGVYEQVDGGETHNEIYQNKHVHVEVHNLELPCEGRRSSGTIQLEFHRNTCKLSHLAREITESLRKTQQDSKQRQEGKHTLLVPSVFPCCLSTMPAIRVANLSLATICLRIASSTSSTVEDARPVEAFGVVEFVFEVIYNTSTPNASTGLAAFNHGTHLNISQTQSHEYPPESIKQSHKLARLLLNGAESELGCAQLFVLPNPRLPVRSSPKPAPTEMY